MSVKPLLVNLTVDPASQKYVGKPVRVQVIDGGKVPLHIQTYPVSLHSHCSMTVNHMVHVTPTSFNLMPGKGTFVTASAPIGKGDFGVLFQGYQTGHGAISLIGAVGSQLLSGGAISCAPPRHAAASAASVAGLPVPFIIAGILAVLFAVLGVYGWRRFHGRKV